MLYFSIRALHLLFMGTWFGASLFTSGDIRRTLAASPDEAALDLLAQRVTRVGGFLGVSGVMTLLSGIALIVKLGGMGAVPWPIHASMLTVLVMIGVGSGGIRLTFAKLHDALKDGGTVDSVQPLVKRIAMLHGIFHALWLLTFVFMVFRHVIAGPAGA